MSTPTAMITIYPNPIDDLNISHQTETIDAALACAQACTTCADV